MKIFIYQENNEVRVGSVASDLDINEIAPTVVPQGVKFWIVDSEGLPSEPQESWVLSDDGTITIDQAKLSLTTRQQLPKLSKRQFSLCLYDNDLYDQVMTAINSDPRFKIEFDTVSEINRESPTVTSMCQQLGWTDEQVDVLWIEALKL